MPRKHRASLAASILVTVPLIAHAQNQQLPHIDYAGLVGRSDIVLAQPNLTSSQAMPLGNGRLGIAVWSEDGLTAQLNRADTMPDRLPLARLVLPGLAALTQASDYSGRLDLYNGEFHEQGKSISATVFVSPTGDNLVVDVTGADPAAQQTALLTLPPTRTPKTTVAGTIGILSETWLDNQQPGASGRSFGSLAAITARARNLSAAVTGPNTITLRFQPYADGHFRILIAGPHFADHFGAAADIAARSLQQIPLEEQAVVQANRNSWHTYWHRAGFMKITSADGTGEYMENLRNLFLFTSAAQSRSEFPGSQAGVADMFSSVLDHMWDPAAFWHWNLRMQVAANLSAGVAELNFPYFNLYRESLPGIEAWTKAHMKGRPGICIPETMRFNGPGIEYENWDKKAPIIGLNCDGDTGPYYNARTISTGAEVSLWIWQHYLATNNRVFLARNFPVMAASARFLLSYATPGADGLLHTSPSNAHETMWDTLDPTTDLAAQTALYTATIQAAKILDVEPALVTEMQTALPKIPPFPRTEAGAAKTLLPSSADAEGNDVIAVSYRPASPNSNVENIGLEPVWPYDLIGDTSPLFPLAQRTYRHRPYPTNQDWSSDPIQAARLQLPDEVRSTLIKLTETYQFFPNGFANWGGKTGEFYIEQEGVTAAALQEALVQDYDGTIRVNPAFPREWDVDGRVAVRGNTSVIVQLRNGKVQTVLLEAGTTGPIHIRNPWPGSAVTVLTPGKPSLSLKDTSDLTLNVLSGKTYQLTPAQAEPAKIEITGQPATTPKKLGPVQIGLFAKTQ